MIIAFLRNEQLTNNATFNPFFFGDYDIAEACLILNGQSFPSERISFNKENEDYIRAFKFMLQNVGLMGDASNGINPSRYMKDCFFFVLWLDSRLVNIAIYRLSNLYINV